MQTAQEKYGSHQTTAHDENTRQWSMEKLTSFKIDKTESNGLGNPSFLTIVWGSLEPLW